jgi:hypothetical protein
MIEPMNERDAAGVKPATDTTPSATEAIAAAGQPEVMPAAAGAAAATETCALCAKPIAAGAGKRLSGQLVCLSCAEQIEAEIAREQPDETTLPRAVIGGAAGGLAGGAAWALIGIFANLEVGYVAVGVGFLAGWGVNFMTGGKRAWSLQVVAAACAFVGLLAAKYFMFAHFAIEGFTKKYGAEAAAELGYVTPKMMQVFASNITMMLSPWDLLWVFLALGAAWRAPAPTQIQQQG